jgi:SAM-dependent methyltransferase
MGDFSAAWLALREPADREARSLALVERLGSALPPAANRRVLDLGAGAGSNLRYLAPWLGPRQHWCCVDQDAGLLAAGLERSAHWAAGQGLSVTPVSSGVLIQGPGRRLQVETRTQDLARLADGLPSDLSGWIRHDTVVTASALLDLVSADWTEALLRHCGRVRAPLLCALSYDGRVDLEPPLALDRAVIGLVNAHQRRDKGLGPALGPRAPSRLASMARDRGYQVWMEPSDWRLGEEQWEIQRALVEGWAQAAAEQLADPASCQGGALRGAQTPRLAGLDRGAIAHWRAARLDAVGAGRSRMRVGHQDALLLAG